MLFMVSCRWSRTDCAVAVVVFGYHNIGVAPGGSAGAGDIVTVVTHEDDPAETVWFAYWRTPPPRRDSVRAPEGERTGVAGTIRPRPI
jgi:hypothetical protein